MDNAVFYIPGYSNLEHLGEGGFGVVYRGTENSSGETRALKVLRVARSAKKEIEALRRVPQHSHIINYKRGITLADNTICLVMEYCSIGNLNDYRLKHPRQPNRDLRFMREIASAVAFLHRNGVIHYDLKPDKILLTCIPDRPTLKVADLGIAKLASDSQHGGNLYNYYTSSKYGHQYFCAPEIFEGRSTEKADVFQMGFIFACLLQKRQAVQNGVSILIGVFVGSMGLGQALYEGELERYYLDEGLDISQDLRTLVENMLDKNHHARPTATKAEKYLKDIEEWPSPYNQEQEGNSSYRPITDHTHGEVHTTRSKKAIPATGPSPTTPMEGYLLGAAAVGLLMTYIIFWG